MMQSLAYFEVIFMTFCNIGIQNVFGGIITQAYFNKSDDGDQHDTSLKLLVDFIKWKHTTTESGIFQSQSVSADKQGEMVIRPRTTLDWYYCLHY